MPRPGFLRNLAIRLATAGVVIPGLLLVFFKCPPWVWTLVVVVSGGVALFEFHSLLEARDVRPLIKSGFLAAALFFVQVAHPDLCPWPTAPAAVVIVFAGALRRSADIVAGVTALAFTLLGAAYIGALGGTVEALRRMEPLSEGPWRMFMLCSAVMIADSFAYFVGHAVGKRRLAPEVSPAKSIEGAIGALVGGVVGVFFVRALGMESLPVLHAVLLGVGVAALGILGDLGESLLKRWAGVKDSGTFFPGHGGMLDRLDSLLFGAPVLYYYFLLVR